MPGWTHQPIPVDLSAFGQFDEVELTPTTHDSELVCETRGESITGGRTGDPKPLTPGISIHRSGLGHLEAHSAVTEIHLSWSPDLEGIGPPIEITGLSWSHNRDGTTIRFTSNY